MPRFFFHTRNGLQVRDEVGTQLPDLKAARREAVKILCQILPTLDEAALFVEGYRISVVSEAGDTMFALDVAVTSAPPSGPEGEA